MDDADDTRTGPSPDPGAGRFGVPRWVTVFGVVVAAAVVLMLVVMILSGGEHGPGRHLSLGPGLDSVARVVGLAPVLAVAGVGESAPFRALP